MNDFGNDTSIGIEDEILSYIELFGALFSIIFGILLVAFFIFSCCCSCKKDNYEMKGCIVVSFKTLLNRFMLFFCLASILKAIPYIFPVIRYYLLVNKPKNYVDILCFPQALIGHLSSMYEMFQMFGLSFALFLRFNKRVKKRLKKLFYVSGIRREKNIGKKAFKKALKAFYEVLFHAFVVIFIITIVLIASLTQEYGRGHSTFCWIESSIGNAAYFDFVYNCVAVLVICLLFSAWISFYSSSTSNIVEVRHRGSSKGTDTLKITFSSFNLCKNLLIPGLFAVLVIVNLVHKSIEQTILPALTADSPFIWIHYVTIICHILVEVCTGGVVSLSFFLLHLKCCFKSRSVIRKDVGVYESFDDEAEKHVRQSFLNLNI